jgi:hypothetical protein
MIPRSLNKQKKQMSYDDDLEEAIVENSYECAVPIDIEDQKCMLETDEKTYYNYGAIEILEDNIEEHIKQSGFSVFDIHVCMYHVNCQNKYPFLQYFLSKNADTFKMPCFQTNNGETVMYLCNSILNVLYTSFLVDNICYKYNGFFCHNNQYYLFFDCSDMKLECHKMNDLNDMWLVCMDEIVNQKKVGCFLVEKDTTRFFTKHQEFMYITDRNGDVYETPTVVYTHCEKRMADFTATFGASASSDDSLYYFTDYERANKTDYTIRYAIFLGNTKYDDSEEDIESCIIYDSLYVGNINKDFLWALKNYDQQVVLTYHKIEKNDIVV